MTLEEALAKIEELNKNIVDLQTKLNEKDATIVSDKSTIDKLNKDAVEYQGRIAKLQQLNRELSLSQGASNENKELNEKMSKLINRK